MRLEVYEQIWHGFGILQIFWHSLYLFFVLGGDFIFDWLELMVLFRLYLGASLYILSFSSCHIVFILLGYTC